VANVVKNTGIPVLSYRIPENSALSALKLKPLATLQFASPSRAPLMYDLVWQSGWFFCDTEHPHPNWSGYMQHVTVPYGEYFPSADIGMLPVTDLNPNDVSCIYSTLVFLEQ
jgi:hypothetical protein